MSALDRLRKLDAELSDGPWTQSRDSQFGIHFTIIGNRATLGLTGCDMDMCVRLRNALPQFIAYMEAAQAMRWTCLEAKDADAFDAAEAAFARALGESDASHPQGGDK